MKDNQTLDPTEPETSDSGIARRIMSAISMAAGTAPKNGPQTALVRGRARRTRRAMERVGVDPDRRTQPHARIGRARLAKSDVQRGIEFRTAVRAELSRIKVYRLVRECAELKYLAGVPGLANVWQLCRASTETMHSIPGLGPARLAKVRAYLVGKNIPVSWSL